MSLDHSIIENSTPNKTQDEWKTNSTPILDTPVNGPTDSTADFVKKSWEE